MGLQLLKNCEKAASSSSLLVIGAVVRELHDVLGAIGLLARLRRPRAEPVHPDPVVATYAARIGVLGVRTAGTRHLVVAYRVTLLPGDICPVTRVPPIFRLPAERDLML